MPGSGVGIFPAGAAGLVQSAMKAATESRSSTTTLADDSDMVLPVVDGKAYTVEALLNPFSTSATPDFKFQLSGPANSTPYWSFLVLNALGTVPADSDATIFGGGGRIVPLIASLLYGIHIKGSWTPTADGNVVVQWAQNTSNATATQLRLGSWLKVTEVG